ncbi:MarR family winged helix-turn-helix transcriptional regulator [Cellulomonas chengniuliangii]|uniref:MarR family transcriptional regulator n=1 Tax=Cellulomonas chengniuliangii TaxID=2968084 RepID=A0ABY5KZM8_9CELL|nr:MarR family transcriptional regulator [Cellulomonas chengniuliangii]MCC2307232.1 MarR family transcriptional regulator [Cellulomonas chengniuliangii]MCC2317872.1 MarR family transcriptional regulator [Cellulomonas chengniuliangii]UUI75972.1 MarR family transcriptional regulator [Cellulomonas chengniuliangii]
MSSAPVAPGVSGGAVAASTASPGPVTAKQCRPRELAGDMRVAVFRTARRVRSERGSADLSDSQFSVLAWLHQNGPMAPGALAERQHVQPPSMTRTVNSLVELGLVAKGEHPTDKRQVVVSLTDAGTAEVRETRRRRDEWLTRRLASFTPEERATLAEATVLLRRLVAE